MVLCVECSLIYEHPLAYGSQVAISWPVGVSSHHSFSFLVANQSPTGCLCLCLSVARVSCARLYKVCDLIQEAVGHLCAIYWRAPISWTTVNLALISQLVPSTDNTQHTIYCLFNFSIWQHYSPRRKVTQTTAPADNFTL